MTAKLSLILLMFFIVLKVNSQHLIGLTQDEVLKKMQETSFVIDNTSKNTSFSYLKYIDTREEKTLLVFLSAQNICTSTKMMSDYSTYNTTIAEFNKNYKKISSHEWTYKVDNVAYKVTLKKEEWFYSIIVTQKK